INKEFQLDDAPAKVHPLLRRCLVRDVRRRMRDIGEARIALEKIAAGEDDVVAAPLPSPAAQRRWLLPAFAAALITAAALGVYIFLPKKPVEQPLVWLKADVEPDPSYRGGIAISRDGSKYVYASSGEQRKLYVRRLDREAAVPISGTDRATHPFLSPDGQWVAFAAEGKLKKVSIDGGVAIPLANIGDEGFRGGSWGEDGHLVAALSANGSLMKISENGGNPTELTKLGKEERAHRFPHHLPDGKGVLFMTAGDGTDYDRSVIEAVSFRDGKRSVLHRGGYHPRYLASGHFAYIFEGALFAAPLNLDRLEAAGPPVPLLSSVRYVSAGSAFLDIARNGTLVYGKGPSRVSTAGLEVRWLLEGQTKTEPLVAAPDLSFFRLSADGSRVAYDKRLSAAEGIWIYDVRRETNTKITFETGGHNPVFSADGKQIVFAAKGGLYWTRADGASKPERILEGVGFVPTSLSPDGRHLLYHHTTPGRQGRSCFLLPLEPSGGAGVPRAGKTQPILEEGASHAVFSPDGKWIAYQNIENRAHVFVRPYPDRGAKWQISAQESGLKPVWSPAGRRLFYLSGSGHAWVVDYAVKGDSFEAGKPRIWSDVQVPPVAAASIQASPDGKRLAANMGRSSNEDAGATKTYVILNFLDEVRRKIKSK
ncbi:MAG: PD40 domain-containing protein, partial [Candidatus Solibacter usitatus]|nr:PD40 domain-containing protein [Candidatus Solibacter usitatus]